MPTLPTDSKIIAFLNAQSDMVAKRDLCRKFGVYGDARRGFKNQLAHLVKHKSIVKKGRTFGSKKLLQETQTHTEKPSPKQKKKLSHKKLSLHEQSEFLQMVVVQKDNDYFARPCQRHSQRAIGDWLKINPDDIVKFKLQHLMLIEAQINDDDYTDYDIDIIAILPRQHSLYSDIFLTQYDIRQTFSDDCLQQAQYKYDTQSLLDVGYQDMRDLPFVTIDGADAKDFDDAVYCEHLGDGLLKAYVAIADVSLYVRPNSPCNKEAYLRGNSVYLAEQAIPMLPHDLSNGACSLKPNEDRACLVMSYHIDAEGNISNYNLCRAVMISKARIIYEDLQEYYDSHKKQDFMGLPNKHFEHLYQAYLALNHWRQKRSALEISSAEYRAICDDDGNVQEIVTRQSLTTHKIIEELMIAANVAAADLLNKRKYAFLSRIHEQPSSEKCEFLSAVLRVCAGVRFNANDAASRKKLNQLLMKMKNQPQESIINDFILRAQMQARYAIEPQGHFGLGLRAYCHFTSPIRRYSDLLVHRALIGAYDLPDISSEKTQPIDKNDLEDMGVHLSQCERNAIGCERGQMQALIIDYMQDSIINQDRQDDVFPATIIGLSRAGLFVRIGEFMAEVFIPKSKIKPQDYYRCDINNTKLIGKNRHQKFTMGQTCHIAITEINPYAQSCVGEMVK